MDLDHRWPMPKEPKGETQVGWGQGEIGVESLVGKPKLGWSQREAEPACSSAGLLRGMFPPMTPR